MLTGEFYQISVLILASTAISAIVRKAEYVGKINFLIYKGFRLVLCNKE